MNNLTAIGSILLMAGLILTSFSFYVIYTSDKATTSCIINSFVETNRVIVDSDVKNNLAKCGLDSISDFPYAIISILGIALTTVSAILLIPKSELSSRFSKYGLH